MRWGRALREGFLILSTSPSIRTMAAKRVKTNTLTIEFCVLPEPLIPGMGASLNALEFCENSQLQT